LAAVTSRSTKSTYAQHTSITTVHGQAAGGTLDGPNNAREKRMEPSLERWHIGRNVDVEWAPWGKCREGAVVI
jgi:hypothetical protein